MRKMKKPVLTKEEAIGILMITPALAVLALVYFYPLGYNIDLSFSNWPIKEALPKYYVGFDNYVRLFFSKDFQTVVWNTLFFTIISVPTEFFLGLGLALLLNREIKGKNVFITLLALPMIVAPVIAALAWKWLYFYDYGALNYVLSFIGVQPIRWMSDVNYSIYSIIIADVWTTTPFMMLILYAGLQMVPTQLYEAAKIDGASQWDTFWRITLPSLKAVLIVALMIRTIDAFTKLFDIVYVITGGGPGYATEVLPTFGYKVAFVFFEFGRGAAVTMITLMLSAVMVVVILRSSRRK
jgi:multiple sugar transport system permease protein